MKIAVVDGNKADREMATRYLANAGHDVTAASDAKGGAALVDTGLPDVLVLDWGLPNAADLLRRVRAMETCEHVYVVVTSTSTVPRDLVSALNAGADDFQRKPLTNEELLARVGGIERIRRWASRVIGGDKAKDWSSRSGIHNLRAWKEADCTLLRDIESMVGVKLKATRTRDPLEKTALGADIPLSLAAEGLEVRLAVGFDVPTLRYLSSSLLGIPEAPKEMLCDMVREFGNTAGGAFKQAASEEGVLLTTGLPAQLDLGRFRQAGATAQQGFLLEAADAPIRIGCQLDIRSKALSRVVVAALQEGMVLARDLLNDAGAMLVPAGTRLTKTQIERVSRFLSPRIAVEVAEAA